MTLEILQKESVEALKNKNKFRREVLADLIGAVKKMGIDNGFHENIPEEVVNAALIKEQKAVQEMIDTCPADRVETLKTYNEKLNIVKEFAPQLISDPEVIAAEITALLESNPVSLEKKNKGKIMKVVMPHFKGRAALDVVNQVLTQMMT